MSDSEQCSNQDVSSDNEKMSMASSDVIGDGMDDDWWNWDTGNAEATEEGENNGMSIDEGADMTDDSLNDVTINNSTSMASAPNPISTPASTRVTASSSIRVAVELSQQASKPRGLLGFFKVATTEEKAYQNTAAFEEIRATADDNQWKKDHWEEKRLQNKRLHQRLRKQKERHRNKERDVKSGLRSPGGRKKSVSHLDINWSMF